MVYAIDIETEVWHKILSLLQADNWRIVYKYDEFDAGVDFDFVILEKEGEEILMGWDNWVQGEIKCSDFRLSGIEKLTGVHFTKGDPVNLKPEVISLYKKTN